MGGGIGVSVRWSAAPLFWEPRAIVLAMMFDAHLFRVASWALGPASVDCLNGGGVWFTEG